MAITSVSPNLAPLLQSVLNINSKLDDLQRQLGTGQKSTVYSGLGSQSGIAVSLSAQLAADLVADIGGDGDHGGGYTHTEHDGYSSQQFSPLLPPEGFVHQAHEHGLLLEHPAAAYTRGLLAAVPRISRL